MLKGTCGLLKTYYVLISFISVKNSLKVFSLIPSTTMHDSLSLSHKQHNKVLIAFDVNVVCEVQIFLF